ncbi:MAG: YkvA family protein [Candidatus Dormibacteraeota bacterium]|nr:YkvA family protein [Candidatus Dormibacteraeota bacterium]
MHPILSRAKALLVDVPRHGKLAYCLVRDERVPAAPKAVLLGALVLIVSPIDLPAWVPLMGELDMLALGVLAVSTFIEACPEDIRREHEAALKAGESVFDRDFRDTLGAAREGGMRLFNRIRRRGSSRDSYQSVSEG